MVIIHDVEQGTNEWMQLRADKYTGSSADKLLKFGSIEYSKTELSKFGGNYYTKRGHKLEDEAIELYERIRKIKVERPGFVTNTKWSDCGYSPDGFLPDRTIEVKCFEEIKHMKMFDGDIPFKILAQIYYGMFICEKKHCDLVIYHDKLEPKFAIKIITFKSRRAIEQNFKRILTKQPRGVYTK